MHSLPVWAVIIISLAVIIAAWFGVHHTYMRTANKYYNNNVLNLTNINCNSPASERLMKLYFNRQQTYEFSGYVILIIALIFLGSCIAIFVYSSEIVKASATDPKDFWISLLSLRIGIAFIIFFICQILLKLYRYCVKIAVFYIGLFDSLLIHKELGKDLKDTIELFMPSADIGENPESPVNEFLKGLGGKLGEKIK